MRSAWADANRGGAPVDSFLEGPVFDANGNLYVTDIPYGRVFRIDARGDWHLVAEFDGEPNGMKFLSDRELLITDYKNGLIALEIATGASGPSSSGGTASASRASTISSSTRAATSTSPTRARRACTTRPAASIAARRTASSTR